MFPDVEDSRIEDILKRDVNAWTPEEQSIITRLIGQGYRQALKDTQARVRDAAWLQTALQ